MFGLEKFSARLGVPGEGFHAHALGVAWMDVFGTALIALLVSLPFGLRWFPLCLLCLWLLSVCLHRMFNVRTAVDRLLFPVT